MTFPARRLGLWRALFYGTYALLGVLHSFIWRLPLIGWEPYRSYQKMAEAWPDFGFAALWDIPYRMVEAGAIPLFLVSIPFFWLLGPCVAAVQMGALLWNLGGLVLIEKSRGDPWEGLWAAALAALGLSHVSYFQLGANGGHVQFLLPLGLAIFLASRFLERAETMKPWAAVFYGFAASWITAFMLPVSILVFVACAVCLLSLPPRRMALLLPFLSLGLMAGAAVVLEPLTRLYEPTGIFRFWREVLSDYFSRLAWFLAQDMATYLSIRGSLLTGYLLETAFLAMVWWGFTGTAFRREPSFRLLVIWSAVMPLWVISYPTYFPETQAPDFFRLRYLGMCWTVWAVFLGVAGVRLWRHQGVSRWRGYLRRAPLVLAGIWVGTGVSLSYAVVDYCNFGVTRRMPLATPLGRIMGMVSRGFRFPGDMNQILASPGELQETQALYFPFRFLFGKNQERLSYIVEQVPGRLRLPFAFGTGLFICEGTISSSIEMQARLPELKALLSEDEGREVDRGCEAARRVKEGTLAFRSMSWPLDDQVMELSSCQLLSGWEYFRTIPVGRQRPRWPWQAVPEAS
ncbi:MAG: hypothetical protein AB1405_04845 [Bdellovibrionota bacterium]